MVRDAENWYRTLGETSSLEELRGCRVAIDAEDYLNNSILFRPGHGEPLVSALGGLPFTFEHHLVPDLQRLEAFDIDVHFVFPGLDISRSDSRARLRQKGARINEEAWDLYDNNLATESVQKFGESTYVQPADYFRAFQQLLQRRGTSYTVAPYSASAQLAYLSRAKAGQDHLVHAVAGSSDILLFSCDRMITGWDFVHDQFHWIQRSRCIEDLSRFTNHPDITEEMFVDACLLAGSSFLPTLPILDVPGGAKVLVPKPRSAIEFILANRGSAYLAVNGVSKQLDKTNRPEYFDDFCKVKFAVKHQPILSFEGKFLVPGEGELPSDPNAFLGCRLPSELVYYVSKGLINTRIVGWEATREIVEPPPIDGGESPQYRALVSSKLSPLRNSAIVLLASPLNRWFQHEKMRLMCWFAGPEGRPFPLQDVEDTRAIVETWHVKTDDLPSNQSCGSLGTAILTLKDTNFAAKTARKEDPKPRISTANSVVFNTLWRFLAVREYVDKNHNLTAWGKVLATIISALKGVRELEEAAVLAVELLRLGLLNADEGMFPGYKGAPIRGTDLERQYNLLVSRVAGLGTLHHKPIGFTGPLSQHMLGFNSMINAVRSASRDLVEVCATQMFISNSVNRADVMNDIPQISMDLPFILPQNCALSIAVKTYLDELVNDADGPSPDIKNGILNRLASSWMPHSTNFRGDLDQAFHLFDAVAEGVKASGDLMRESEKRFWSETGAWLQKMR